MRTDKVWGISCLIAFFSLILAAIVGWIYGPNSKEVQMQFESANRIMIYPTLELATRALSWLRDRYKTLSRDDREFMQKT